MASRVHTDPEIAAACPECARYGSLDPMVKGVNKGETMPDKQTSTKRWDPNAKGPGRGGYVSETTGRDLGSTTDYQNTSGLAAAAARARAKRKPPEEESTEDQAEALSKPRKKKAAGGY